MLFFPYIVCVGDARWRIKVSQRADLILKVIFGALFVHRSFSFPTHAPSPSSLIQTHTHTHMHMHTHTHGTSNWLQLADEQTLLARVVLVIYGECLEKDMKEGHHPVAWF